MFLLRRLLLVMLSLVLLVVGGLAILFFVVFAPTSTVGAVAFDQALKIPPLATSRVDSDGTRVFELTARAGTTELLPGHRTRTLGYNGSYLGPTLRAARGEKVRIEVHNELDETTTTHWHGMHLPAEDDGGPHQPIKPGGTWKPSWRIDQPAATLWYHPHPEGKTEEQVNKGLAGMFILDDPASKAAARLPHDYGVDDIPVIVQDKKLDEDGDLGSGGLGDDVLVNGTYGPYLHVTTQRVRLRLLNASDKRVYAFGLSDGRDFSMIGTGGGLLHSPFRTNRVQLAPGERAEIVVTMRPDDDVVLRSFEPDLGSNFVFSRFEGGQDELDLLELRSAARLRPSPRIPAELAPAPNLDVSDARTRTFEMRGRKINDKQMKMSRIDQTVELGSTEIWKVTNTGGEYHDFHVHDVQFEVLSVDGHEPEPQLSGWKDTVFMPPGRTVRLAMRFTDYADPNTPYMYHCHLLDHEDAGMMGQFVVVKHGHAAGAHDSR